jgi:hypothetical protein
VSGETWVAIVAALIALAALYFNWRSTQEASRAATAAEEQTKIQRQLRIDAAQPYVWVDIRPDESQGMMLNLVVGNSGPTVAEKVRVQVDPHLPSTAELRELAEGAGTLLSDGIESLPPGRTLMWPLGAASKVMNESGRDAYKFTVTAKGPFGQVPALTYIVNMTDWWNSLDRPAGSLHQLTLAVKDLGKKISKQTVPNHPRRAQANSGIAVLGRSTHSRLRVHE